MEETTYEIDKYDPNWQIAQNGFYYRPKSVFVSSYFIVIKLTTDLINSFLLKGFTRHRTRK